jgi:flavoprotein
MGKKLPYTPKSRIQNWIRRGWLTSRERAKVIKAAKYTCCRCGRKQSKAKGKELKVEVHHKAMINWEKIVEFIRKEVLDKPQEVLCVDCHKEETKKQRESK